MLQRTSVVDCNLTSILLLARVSDNLQASRTGVRIVCHHSPTCIESVDTRFVVLLSVFSDFRVASLPRGQVFVIIFHQLILPGPCSGCSLDFSTLKVFIFFSTCSISLTEALFLAFNLWWISCFLTFPVYPFVALVLTRGVQCKHNNPNQNEQKARVDSSQEKTYKWTTGVWQCA